MKYSSKNSLEYNTYGDLYLIKRLILIYFFLLLFEGALRKWFYQDYQMDSS